MFNSFKMVINFLLIVLLCLFSFSSPAIAQSPSSFPYINSSFSLSLTLVSTNSYNTLAFLRWLFGRGTKDDTTRPAETQSAARRGKCSDVSRSFIGLIPPVVSLAEAESTSINGSMPSTQIKSFVGLTAEAFPTLWFHIPELPDDVENLELMIQDDQNVDVIPEPVDILLSSDSGIYSIDWSVTRVPLELGKSHHWYLSIVCDADRPSRNPSIDGWVQRVSLTSAIEEQLESTTDEREQISLYIKDGIWHEALTRLAKLRCAFPDDEGLKEDWTTLLTSIGIPNDIAIAPILQCSIL